MKIVVLGGSAAGPNTGAGCAGFLVTEGETTIAIDLGPGTLPELRKHTDYRRLSGIVISHCHLDHILDLGALRYLALYNPVPMQRTIPLYVPPESSSFFAQWGAAMSDNGAFFEPVLSLDEYDPASSLTIGELSIQFARTVHPVPAWAMRVSGKRSGEFGYTADTGPTCDLSGFLQGVSLLVSEATEPADTMSPWEPRGHMTAAEAAHLAELAHVKALVLGHRWEELGLERAAQEAGAVFHGPIMVARPGLTVFV